jgi:hypothetical protein
MNFPNNVFDKKYAYYYLFSSGEIVMKDDFYVRLARLINENNSNRLTIKLKVPKELKNEAPAELILVKPNSKMIDDFYSQEIKSGSLPLHAFDHYMHDDYDQWEAFISDNHEIGIFACNKKVNALFVKIFQPYDDTSINDKLNFIKLRFKDTNAAKAYVETLRKSYDL